MESEFNSLVENALDFLEKSTRELEAGEPKYSVINFYSGLELLLKARLLKEHWCLCASNVNQTAPTQFAAGDFESIGLTEAKSRLANILNCKLSAPEEQVYELLRKRRNRAVHFYHSDDLGTKKKVAVEQLAGWYFLYRRLTSTWLDSFVNFHDRIKALHRTVSARSEYFPTIYANIKEDLQIRAKNRLLTFCDFCEQRSALTEGPVIKGVHRMHCVICEMDTFAVFLPCKKCGNLSSRLYDEESECPSCRNLHKADVEESFAWATKTYPAATPCAWCDDCGYTVTESVIPIEVASLCLACHSFREYSDISCCEWCGDIVTGAVGSRIAPGCVRCAYHLTYESPETTPPDFLHTRQNRKAHRALRQGGFI